MYCSNCGADNREGAKFCEKCGKPMNMHPQTGKMSPVGKNKKLITIAVVCAVLVLICIMCITAYFNNSNMAEYNAQMDEAANYLEEMDYEKAETAYFDAIDIKPRKEDAYIELADMYILQREPEKAIEILEKGKKKTHSKDIKLRLKKIENSREQYKAYYDLCMKYQDKYGNARYLSYVYDDGAGELAGLSTVRLVDFNADGNEELLIAYSNSTKDSLETSFSEIYYEVWAWQKNELVSVFPATKVNHGTDVSGWIAVEMADEMLHIYESVFTGSYYSRLSYYDGEKFNARFESYESAFDEKPVRNEFYINGESVSHEEYESCFAESLGEMDYYEDLNTPYKTADGEFQINFRSMKYEYAEQVFDETKEVLEYLEGYNMKETESTEDGVPNEYKIVIQQYEELAANSGSDAPFDYGEYVNIEAAGSVQDYGYNLYYSLKDIDDNGIKELLVGCGESINEVRNYDIYTLNNGKITELFPDYCFGYRTNFEVYDDGTIGITASGSAWDTRYQFYKLNKNGYEVELIELCESVSEWDDYNSEEPEVVYYDKNGQKISKVVFDKAANKYSSKRKVSFNWIVIN